MNIEQFIGDDISQLTNGKNLFFTNFTIY
jgi:hypothetical protein